MRTKSKEDEPLHLLYDDLRKSAAELTALMESTVADSTKITLTLIQHHLELIGNYQAAEKMRKEATENHQEAINDLVDDLRGIQRQSCGSSPDELETHGIRFSEYNIIEQLHIEQRLYDTLSIALPSLNQRKDVTSIAQASASIVAQYIVDYLTILRGKPTLTEENLKSHNAPTTSTKKPFDHRSLTQWLCQTTDINANITNDIGIANLNTEQTRRINKLCQAFIRGKMPSLKLNLDEDQTVQQNLQAGYQRDIGTALSSAIESEQPTLQQPLESRFHKRMKGLPEGLPIIIKTQPIDLNTALTTGHDPTKDKIAQVISSYVILYIKLVTGDSEFSQKIDDTKLANRLALTLIDTKENLGNIDTNVVDGLNKKQIQHVLNILKYITPVQSKNFEYSDFAVNFKRILTIGSLSDNAKKIFSSLPDAINLVINKQQSTYSGATHVIPPDFLTLLQSKGGATQEEPEHTPEKTAIIDWITNHILSLKDETHKQAWLDLFIEKYWLTDKQIQAIQTKNPVFNPAKKSQSTQREINELLTYLEQRDNRPDPKKIKEKIQAITRIDSSLEAQLGQCNARITSTHNDKQEAEYEHSQAKEELEKFHKLFQQWIQLAIAGTDRYLVNNTNTIFTGGRTRANSLLAKLKTMEINSKEESFNEGSFNTLKEAFEKFLTTFSNGSLGTYIVQAITEKNILGHEKIQGAQEPEDPQEAQEIQFATKQQYEDRLDVNGDSIQFKEGQGPTGTTSNLEAIQNSELSRVFNLQTSLFNTRQTHANTIYSHLNNLDTQYQGLRGQ